MQEKRGKIFAYCRRRQRGREVHKGVIFLLEYIFQFCWRTTLSRMPLSYLNRLYPVGSTLEGLGWVFILHSPDSFHQIISWGSPFWHRAFPTFFTCRILARSEVKIPFPCFPLTSVLAATHAPVHWTLNGSSSAGNPHQTKMDRLVLMDLALRNKAELELGSL